MIYSENRIRIVISGKNVRFGENQFRVFLKIVANILHLTEYIAATESAIFFWEKPLKEYLIRNGVCTKYSYQEELCFIEEPTKTKRRKRKE